MPVADIHIQLAKAQLDARGIPHNSEEHSEDVITLVDVPAACSLDNSYLRNMKVKER